VAQIGDGAAPAADEAQVADERARVYRPLQAVVDGHAVSPREMEARLQKTLEHYAGGATVSYELNEERLAVAEAEVDRFPAQVPYLHATSLHDLMQAHSVIDRVDVAQALVRHLRHRRETRWPSYQTRVDYPARDDARWLVFVNSRRDPATGQIHLLERPYEQLVDGDRYRPNG